MKGMETYTHTLLRCRVHSALEAGPDETPAQGPPPPREVGTMVARHPLLAVLAALAAGLVACGDARPVQTTPGGTGACTSCHGTTGRVGNLPGTDQNLAAAPPIAPPGAPSDVIGAHQAHLNPLATGSARGPIACVECHDVPQDASHATNPPAQRVQFGALATTGGAQATWNGVHTPTTIDTPTCSNVYCHGNFSWSGVTGNLATPNWTAPPGQLSCTSCHGLPPTGHFPVGTVVTAATCNGCHSGTVDPNGNIVVSPAGTSRHVNGQADVDGTLTCTSCHGGTDNLTGAPPVDTLGRIDTSLASVGAHTSHVEVGPVAGAFDCGECHVKPTAIDSPGHLNGTVEVVFGALAGTGVASPVWNFGASPPTCSSVYCHGATLGGGTGTILTPAWTVVDGSQASCGKCHGLPPPAHVPLAAGSTNATCSACHDQTVLPSGSIDVPGGKHVNGLPEVIADLPHPAGWLTPASLDFHAIQVNSRGPAYCQTCHAFQPPAQVTTVVCSTCHNGTLASNLATCTGCHGGTDSTTGAPPRATWGNQADAVRVGAHTSHLAGTHALSNPVACGECHVVPADAFSAGHVDQPTATLTWGALATTGGASPTWTRGSATCAASYCHGSTLPTGTGTFNRTPVWTTVDGSQITCGTSCHGSPPPTGTTIGVDPAHVWHVTAAAGPHQACTVCHANIPNAAGTAIVTPALHVNGAVNAYQANTTTPVVNGWACNNCH